MVASWESFAVVGLAALVGLLIPGAARRMARRTGRDPASVLAAAIPRPYKRDPRVRALRCALERCGVAWGVGLGVCMGVAVALAWPVPPWSTLVLISFLGLAAEVDRRSSILPDVLTLPLLLAGLVLAPLGLEQAVLGAVVGFALPVLAGLLLHRVRPGAMGGGDVKLLMALGAWVGPQGLAAVVLVALPVFAAERALQGARTGPLGPALALGGVVVHMVF